jgi:hypothetical protein
MGRRVANSDELPRLLIVEMTNHRIASLISILA